MPDVKDSAPPCDTNADFLKDIPDASLADGATTTGVCLGCAKSKCKTELAACSADCACQGIAGEAIDCYAEGRTRSSQCGERLRGELPTATQNIGLSAVRLHQQRLRGRVRDVGAHPERRGADADARRELIRHDDAPPAPGRPRSDRNARRRVLRPGLWLERRQSRVIRPAPRKAACASRARPTWPSPSRRATGRPISSRRSTTRRSATAPRRPGLCIGCAKAEVRRGRREVHRELPLPGDRRPRARLLPDDAAARLRGRAHELPRDVGDAERRAPDPRMRAERMPEECAVDAGPEAGASDAGADADADAG